MAPKDSSRPARRASVFKERGESITTGEGGVAIDDQPKVVYEYLHHPQIPLMRSIPFQKVWCRDWAIGAAVVLLCCIPTLWASPYYKVHQISLPDIHDQTLNLDIESAGCDIRFEPRQKGLVRLTYWTFYAKTPPVFNHTGSNLKIKAIMTQKVLDFHCLITIHKPLAWSDHSRTADFGSFSLKLDADDSSLHAPKPSNVIETTRVYLEDATFARPVHLECDTFCELYVNKITAPSLNVKADIGGAARLFDVDATTNVDMNHGMAYMKFMRSDALLSLVNGAEPYAAIAAKNLTRMSNTGVNGTTQNWNLSCGTRAGVTREGPPVTVSVQGRNTAFYFIGSSDVDASHGGPSGDLAPAKVCSELEMFNGAQHLHGPGILPEGIEYLSHVNQWLTAPLVAPDKYVAYIALQLPLAHPTRGLLELVSTPAYEAFWDLSAFTLLSAGMISPEITRISVPALGFTDIFPAGICEDARLWTIPELGLSMLSIVDPHVDINKAPLNRSTATWMWKPEGHDIYLFDRVRAQHGRPASWSPRILSNVDVIDFFVATSFSFIVGLVAGIAALIVAFTKLLPMLLQTINQTDLFNTSSYRLTHVSSSEKWPVSGTALAWPVNGILLRWKNRGFENLENFTFEARPWPLKVGGKVYILRNCDPDDIPSMPGMKEQRAFLFPTDLILMSKWFPTQFENDLHECCKQVFDHHSNRRMGTKAYALPTGRPYQCRITAYDATGTVLDTSSWTRAILVRSGRSIAEYPLLLWRSIGNMLPQDTFSYFLSEHCLPINAPPACIVTLSNLRLVMRVHDLSLFAGAAPAGSPGAAKDVHAVTVHICTAKVAGKPLDVDVRSSPFTLPNTRLGDGSTALRGFDKVCYEEAPKKAGIPDPPHPQTAGLRSEDDAGAPSQQFTSVAFGSEAIKLTVGNDLSQQIFFDIELAVNGVNTNQAATCRMTWEDLLRCFTRAVADADGARSDQIEFPPGHLTDTLVLQHDSIPAGVLQADFAFASSVLGPHTCCPSRSGLFQGLFDRICPCISYVYGQTVVLTYSPTQSDSGVEYVIDLNWSPTLPKKGLDGAANPKYNSPHEKHDRRIVVFKNLKGMLPGDTAGTKQRANVCLLAESKPGHQVLRCKLELHVKGNANIEASSAEFLIIRPVLSTDLELAYASFCIRNKIRMEPVGDEVMERSGFPGKVVFSDRTLWVIQGFRLPLTIPQEREYWHTHDQVLIKNKVGSMAVWRDEEFKIRGKTESTAKGFSSSVAVFDALGACIEEKLCGAGKPNVPKAPEAQPLLDAEASAGLATKAPPVPVKASNDDLGQEAAVTSKSAMLKKKLKSKVQNDAPEEIETFIPQSRHVQLPMNVFWSQHDSWAPKVHLVYAMLPKIGLPGAVQGMLKGSGFSFLGFLFSPVWVDPVITVTLSSSLYFIQMFALCSPAFLLLGMWIGHNYIYSITTPDLLVVNTGHLFLSDWIMAPTHDRWLNLSEGSRVCVYVCCGYVFMTVIVAFYSNFLHDLTLCQHRYYDRVPANKTFFGFINKFLVGSATLAFAVFVLYLSMVLVWALLGALIDPVKLMPYALVVGFVGYFAHSISAKIASTRKFVMDRVNDKLDMVLHALMDEFSDEPDLASQIQDHIGEFNDLASKIVDEMATDPNNGELLLRAALFEATSIDVNKASIALPKPMPKSKAKAKAKATNFLSFVPADNLRDTVHTSATLARATPAHAALVKQAKIIEGDISEEASIKAARLKLVNNLIASPAENQACHTMRAFSQPKQPVVSSPGVLTDEETATLAQIAKDIHLRPETAQVMYGSYQFKMHAQAVKLKTGILKQMQNEVYCAQLFSHIRRSQLFSFFSADFTPASLAMEAVAASAAQLKETGEKGSPAPTSAADFMAVMSVVKETQMEEMDGWRDKVAIALTSILKWPVIKEQANSFATRDVPDTIVRNAVSKELNSEEVGTAACRLLVRCYEVLYDRFDSSYKEDPVQLFVDINMITQAEKDLKSQAYEKIASLLPPGATPPDLLAAVKGMCFSTGDADTSDRLLWLPAVISMLATLGWSADEMKAEFIEDKWKQQTKGLMLFEYNSLSEVHNLIMLLCGNKLWRAAVKMAMVQTKICGYIGCNITATDYKEANTNADIIDACDRFDLGPISAASVWPEWVEEKYQGFCKGKDGEPGFMPPTRLVDFMESLIYDMDEEIENKNTYVPMSPGNTDPRTLQWRMQKVTPGNKKPDTAVWHFMPDGNCRELRGLWLEVALAVFAQMDCIQHQPEVFFSGLLWQSGPGIPFLEKVLAPDAIEDIHRPVGKCFLKVVGAKEWLCNVYLQEKRWVSFMQFKKILSLLKVQLAPKSYRQIFDNCPWKPADDDNHELRCLTDLGAALYIWMGYGLWREAVKCVVDYTLPNGAVKNQAWLALKDEFKAMDKKQQFILQPAEVCALLSRICNPGLTCAQVQEFVTEDLKIAVPEREIHKYFTLMDVDENNILSAEEFVKLTRYMMISHFPQYILAHIKLDTVHTIKVVLSLSSLLILIFALVTLVIQTFAGGRDVVHVLHSAFTTGSGVAVKMQSAAGGSASGAADMIAWAEGVITAALISTIGLSKGVCDRIIQVAKQFEDGTEVPSAAAKASAKATAKGKAKPKAKPKAKAPVATAKPKPAAKPAAKAEAKPTAKPTAKPKATPAAKR